MNQPIFVISYQTLDTLGWNPPAIGTDFKILNKIVYVQFS